MRRKIDHFTHHHSLFEVNDNEDYICDGCRTGGRGTRFSCHTHGCDFDLHEYCGICPDIHSSFRHPEHPAQHPPLNLVRRPHTPRHYNRGCNVCGQRIEGLFYMCSVCQFDVHPMCTQQPMVPPAPPPPPQPFVIPPPPQPFGIPYGVQCLPPPQPLGIPYGAQCPPPPPCPPYACYCMAYGFRVCRFR